MIVEIWELEVVMIIFAIYAYSLMGVGYWFGRRCYR